MNGEKKFITSGTKAHYFTVAVRTGGSGAFTHTGSSTSLFFALPCRSTNKNNLQSLFPCSYLSGVGIGMNGVSLLLVERNMPGVSVRRQKTQGWLTSGTAYIVLEDVKVTFHLDIVFQLYPTNSPRRYPLRTSSARKMTASSLS